jgi:hypothetical protein
VATLFLTSERREINRVAIIEENKGAAWLYLMSFEPSRILGTAWLFNRAGHSDGRTMQERLKRGDAPRMPRSRIADEGVRRRVRAAAIEFLWSADGDSVAVFENDKPLAYVSVGQDAGRNRHIIKNHRYARPFDEAEFERLFRHPS